MALVDRLAPIAPLARQPDLARDIAEVIASSPSSMYGVGSSLDEFAEFFRNDYAYGDTPTTELGLRVQ